jgi:hypothetical protein
VHVRVPWLECRAGSWVVNGLSKNVEKFKFVVYLTTIFSVTEIMWRRKKG